MFAIYCPNLPEYAVAFYGVLLAGGTNTTVNPLYTVEELAAQLRDAGASYLSVADLGEEETGVAVLPFSTPTGRWC